MENNCRLLRIVKDWLGLKNPPRKETLMFQLWKAIARILGLVDDTDSRVKNLAGDLAALTMEVEKLKAVTLIRFDDIEARLVQLLDVCRQIQSAVMPLPAVSVSITVKGEEVTQMQIKDTDVLDVSFAAKDAKGNPTSLAEGAAPSWDVSDASLATIEPAADGMSAKVTPVGPLGSFQVQLAIPAVDGEGALSGSLDVEVTASAATEVALSGAVE